MELDKELYTEIKEYCLLNGLKPRDYIHNLLKKAFMEDKYGTAPFISVKATSPLLDKKAIEEADKAFENIIETVGGADKFNDLVTEATFSDDNTAEKKAEVVAEKAINAEQPSKDSKKVTKRKIKVN